MLESPERGAWLLIHEIDKVFRIGLEPPSAEHTGFVQFKEKSFVVFYTNYLSNTPRKDVEGN